MNLHFARLVSFSLSLEWQPPPLCDPAGAGLTLRVQALGGLGGLLGGLGGLGRKSFWGFGALGLINFLKLKKTELGCLQPGSEEDTSSIF